MTQAALLRPRAPKRSSEEIIRKLTELFPAQDEIATKIAIALYRQLARMDRVSIEDVAAAAGVSGDHVTAQLAAWPAVYRDDEGAVIGFWGLTAHPMTHRFTVAGRERYTWCAWDSLFIPELIGEAAEVQSITPIDRREVRLRVLAQGAIQLDPSAALLHVSFLLPEADEWEADVIATFCHHVFFLYDDEIERWLADNPSGVTLSLAEAHRAGQSKNAHQFQR